jgi:hypothetical protein
VPWPPLPWLPPPVEEQPPVMPVGPAVPPWEVDAVSGADPGMAPLAEGELLEPSSPPWELPTGQPPTLGGAELTPPWLQQEPELEQSPPFAPPPADDLEPSPVPPWELEASPMSQPAPWEMEQSVDPALAAEFAPQDIDEKLAVDAVDREEKRRQLVAEQQLATLRSDRERAEENDRIRAEADAVVRQRLVEIDRDAKELASASIDTGRFMRNQGAGQQLAGLLAAGLSGFLNPRGPNQGIDMALRLINQDIDAQRADIEQRRWSVNQQQGIVGDLFRQTGDAHRAAETARLAMLDRAEKEILASAQQFDPMGTQYQRRMEAVQKVRGEKAAAWAKLTAEQQKAETDRQKAVLDARKAESEIADKLHGQKMAEQANRRGWAQIAEEKRKNLKAEDLAKDKLKTEKEEKGLTIPGAKDSTGAPIVAQNEADAKIVKDQLEASGKAIRLLQQLSEMREKIGPSFASWTSEERAKASALHSKAVVMLKEAGKLGTLDKGSEGVIKQQIGENISAFLDDPKSRIDATRESLYQDLQMTMKIRSKGQTPDMESVRTFVEIPGKPGAPDTGLILPPGATKVDLGKIELDAFNAARAKAGIPRGITFSPFDVEHASGALPGLTASQTTAWKDEFVKAKREATDRATAEAIAAAPDKAITRGEMNRRSKTEKLQSELRELEAEAAAGNWNAEDLEAYEAKKAELKKLTGGK